MLGIHSLAFQLSAQSKFLAKGGGRGKGVGGRGGAGDISSTLPYTALRHGASPYRDLAQQVGS